MSTTVIIPVACDEHEVTSIPARYTAYPYAWAIVGLKCWDCNVIFWADDEGIFEIVDLDWEE